MIFLAIFFAFMGACLVALAGVAFTFFDLRGVKQGSQALFIFLMGLFLITCSFFNIHKQGREQGHEQGYKQGQIDASQGEQKYHLTTRPKVWELKEKE
ncbi:hypothetical protein HN803_04405 [candidate division WWE3 bacterium]|jgi:hypothetical protein|nr:hypothetical protein [candidate division WWE3 bacterium]